MNYSVNLVDIIGIVIAAACLRSTWADMQGAPQKVWRLGLTPLLGNVVSLVILAGAVASFQHDATWVATAGIGALAGMVRGRQITVQTDQMWGTARTSVAYDAVIAAFCILVIATADGISGVFKPGTLPRHADMAAASALFSGFLGGRAWLLMRRAVNSPHTDLGTC